MLRSTLDLPEADLRAIFAAVGPRWERLRGQRLLLTGGTGFIGKWLLGSFLYANRRLGLGATVVVVSRQPAAFARRFPEVEVSTEIEWIDSDVRAFKLHPSQRCGFAVHAATDVAVVSSPDAILDTCIEGTRRVLTALGDAGPRRVLLLSSGAVYGRQPAGMARVHEDWIGAPDPLLPASVYGEGKRISELLCAMAAAASPGLEVSIARAFAFVGPHLPMDRHFAIGNFIDAALRGQDINIGGDGTPQRSYLYAAELTHWLWILLFDGAGGRAYNVGGDETVSIIELAQRVRAVLGSSSKITVARSAVPGAAPQVYVPALERIGTELGLVPQVGLDEAIRRTAQWARQHIGE